MLQKAKELNEITKEMIDLNKATIKTSLEELEPLLELRAQDTTGKKKKACMCVNPCSFFFFLQSVLVPSIPSYGPFPPLVERIWTYPQGLVSSCRAVKRQMSDLATG
jgi:hypothetical protein